MPNTTQLMSVSGLILKSINSTLNTLNNSTKQSSKNLIIIENHEPAIISLSILVPLIIGVSVLICYFGAKRNKERIIQKQMEYSILLDERSTEDTETLNIKEINRLNSVKNKAMLQILTENKSSTDSDVAKSNKINENLSLDTGIENNKIEYTTESKKEQQYTETKLKENPIQLTECSAEALAEQEESIAI